MEALMLRTLLGAGLILAAGGSALAQEAPKPKPFEANTLLKDGRRIEVREASIVGGKICGSVLEEGASLDATPKSECIAPQDIARTKLLRRMAGADAIDGGLCVILMPLCLARVKAVQERIVDRAFEKAKAAPAITPTPARP
jgi:hypothetical protein